MSFFNFLSSTPAPLIDRSTDRLATMLETASTMFEAATSCLLDNHDLQLDLKSMDDTINEGEREIRRSVLEHMAINPSDDLSHSLLLLSVVQDAERCGDLGKSIAKASAMAEQPRTGRHVESLRAIRDRIARMYPSAIAALRAGDAGQAHGVMATHDEIKREVADYLQALAAADDLSLNQGVVLTLGAQYIGRVSSHLSNVSSMVAMPFDLVRNSPQAA